MLQLTVKHTLCYQTPKMPNNCETVPIVLKQHSKLSTIMHCFFQSNSTTPSSPVFCLNTATNCRRMLFQWVSYWIWIWHCWESWENNFLINSLLALMRKQVTSISYRWHAVCSSECVGLNLRNHPIIVSIQVKYIIANNNEKMCVYYPIGRGGYISSR